MNRLLTIIQHDKLPRSRDRHHAVFRNTALTDLAEWFGRAGRGDCVSGGFESVAIEGSEWIGAGGAGGVAAGGAAAGEFLVEKPAEERAEGEEAAGDDAEGGFDDGPDGDGVC